MEGGCRLELNNIQVDRHDVRCVSELHVSYDNEVKQCALCGFDADRLMAYQ